MKISRLLRASMEEHEMAFVSAVRWQYRVLLKVGWNSLYSTHTATICKNSCGAVCAVSDARREIGLLHACVL